MEFVAPVLSRLNGPQEMRDVVLAEPRHGEVRIRMVAAGVCHSCLSTAAGDYGPLPLPMILGDEGAGVVDGVSRGAALDVGDHVIVSWAPSCARCQFCTSGLPGLCRESPPLGYMSDGTSRFRINGDQAFHMGPSTYSPYIVVHESAAIKIRRDISLENAALIGCAVTTGVGAVLNTAQARVGDTITIFGCGGVGLSAIQGAVMTGANPIIAVDVVDMKLEAAARLGATDLINASAEDPVEGIQRLTEGGADVAIVATGTTAVMEQAMAALGPRGICVLVGAPSQGSSLRVDPLHLIFAERRLVGCRYGSSNPHVAFPRLVELYLAGKLKLDELISHTYQLEQVNEAHRALSDGRDIRGLLVFD